MKLIRGVADNKCVFVCSLIIGLGFAVIGALICLGLTFWYVDRGYSMANLGLMTVIIIGVYSVAGLALGFFASKAAFRSC
jgi:hypothetical protein